MLIVVFIIALVLSEDLGIAIIAALLAGVIAAV